MSIETLLKNATQALNSHASALNRFCDFCETNGVDLAIDTLTDNLAQAEKVVEAPVVSQVMGIAPQVSNPTPAVSDEVKAPVRTAEAPVTLPQAEISNPTPAVSNEPTATAPVIAETVTPEADSIEAGLWIPQDEEREDDVAEPETQAPAVEEPAPPAKADTKITVSDVADSMKKLLPNRNAIVAVLDQFGVGKVTELKAEDLAKAKQLFDQALQGV